MPLPMSSPLAERRLLFLLGAAQFVNVLDFMIVMPLGPDFAVELGIPSARLPLVASAYTGAASVSGLAGAFFLDRFDRRKALVVALIGLALGTIAAAFAQGQASMLTTRLVAGAFGGPATALVYSIIADAVPPERRGRAIGAVMSAFTIAAAIGVPAGLRLSLIGGWKLPFIAVGGLIFVVALVAAAALPPMRGHLDQPGSKGFDLGFVRRPLALGALALSAVVFMGNFLVIPSISPYIQFNLSYPREHIELLYMAGGAATFFTMRLAGRAVDRRGAALTAAFGSALFVVATLTGFGFERALLPVPVFFVLFMTAASFRMVPSNAVMSRIPRPAERARYMSIQSFVQHLATTGGAVLASAMMSGRPDQTLEGMNAVAFLAAGTALVLPLGLAVLEPRVRGAEVAAARAAVPGPGG
jgi:predicted MFS family arabinose efflux permease